MCDITRLREMCRDYNETSDRVSKSLTFLKHELRSLRQQDIMLLKQLVSINDVISGIKLSRQQRSGSAATLPRSTSSTHSTTLNYSMSLRRPLGDVTRPVRFISGVQKAEYADGRHTLSIQSPFPWQTSCSSRISLESPQPIQESELVVDSTHIVNGSNNEHQTYRRGADVWRRSGNGLSSVEIRNKYNENIGCALFVTDEVLPKPSGKKLLNGIVEVPKMRDSMMLRCSTTSIDTLQSQVDSVYGSGSDLHVSNDSLYTTGNDPALSSGIDGTKVILV